MPVQIISGTHVLLLAGIAAASPALISSPESNGGGRANIATPSLYQSPRFRWWWPNGWIDPAVVEQEITAIIDAGFGGGEIGDVEDSVTVDVDPNIYGWGEDRWNDGVLSAYEGADALGGHVDLTLGPHWPTGIPGYTPDSPSTSKELVHGQVFIDAGATYSGPLPLPVAAPSGNETANVLSFVTPFLVGILTARTTTVNASSTATVKIDPSTVKILNATVPTGANATNATVSFTAPSDGPYVLVAAYGRGTGQIPNMYDGNPSAPKLTSPFPPYIIDHFSKAGVESVSEYWDAHLLTPQLRPLLQKSEGSFFEDSLELKYKQYWTPDFLSEFSQRRGYDLTPYILYVLQDTNTFTGDATTATQVQNDFYQTVSDLYADYHVGGYLSFAHSVGLKLRIQPYTATWDSAYIASLLDIPEGESLGFQGDDDAFRVLATGRDVGGKTTILSDELGAYMGLAYGVTWKFLLGTLNHDVALGVSQAVIHGFPYRDSPSSLWPGFAPFTPLGGSSNGFADAWGPRQPQWMFAKNASTYMANAQSLMQEGGPSIDIAILNQDWGVTATWDDATLNGAGFSYQFPSPGLLQAYKTRVSGKRLAAEGPAYKALVVFNETTMDISTAQLLLSYAKSGLPIVLSSNTPPTTFTKPSDRTNASAELASLFEQIRAQPSTAVVDTTAEVPSALTQLGVNPLAKYSESNNDSVITYRRTYGSGYIYWIYNNNQQDAVAESISLEGNGSPYSIDLWTGSVDPIASFSSAGGYVTLNVSIVANASSVIYVGTSNSFGAPALSKHLTGTDCDTYVSSGQIHLLTNASCSATTSTGQTVSASAKDLPADQQLDTWTLTVRDWSPAQANESALNSSLTTKTWLAPINLTTLVPWPDIQGLESASGIGTYQTTVALEKTVSNTRVLLDVYDVEGTYGVSINGQSISGVSQFINSAVDITDYLTSGDNVIEITVATTLWNKLIKVWPAVYGSDTPQNVGLLGPVTLRYVQDVLVPWQ